MKRKLGTEKGKESREAGDDEAGLAARVEAEDECAALREAVVSAQSAASALQAEVEERLAAASTASEAMAMMLRLQREKAEVQMELRQFRRFADEKMALDAADIDQLRALLAQRARRLVRLRARLREYRLQFLHLGIPLPEGEGEDLVAQSTAEEEEDLLLLEGEDGYVDGDGRYYPELRCNDGEYYYEDRKEEEDAVALNLERRIYRLEHHHKTRLPNLSGHERGEGERKGRRWEQLRRQLHGRRGEILLPSRTRAARSRAPAHRSADGEEAPEPLPLPQPPAKRGRGRPPKPRPADFPQACPELPPSARLELSRPSPPRRVGRRRRRLRAGPPLLARPSRATAPGVCASLPLGRRRGRRRAGRPGRVRESAARLRLRLRVATSQFAHFWSSEPAGPPLLSFY
ncbi:uncharacterized protein [Miscanthus floridulus]|uniref:uncharacterized protein n=1 Tax=Miscanthus floridulus TaxID=154761 RepID=UPI003457C2B7